MSALCALLRFCSTRARFITIDLLPALGSCHISIASTDGGNARRGELCAARCAGARSGVADGVRALRRYLGFAACRGRGAASLRERAD